MSTVYAVAPKDVEHRIKKVIKLYHEDLHTQEVTVDALVAYNENGPAVKHQGYSALAVISIQDLKARVMGMSDALVVIDGKAYEDMSPEQRDALIDHELTHLLVQRDNFGAVKFDDHARPMLTMKKHDVQFGWFVEVAQRHGLNSPEVIQARRMRAEYDQTFWPNITGDFDTEEAENQARAYTLEIIQKDKAAEQQKAVVSERKGKAKKRTLPAGNVD